MKFRKHILGLVVGCLLLPTSGLFAQATAVQEDIDYKTVIADFLEATGGEEAHKAIESVTIKGTMSIPNMGMEGKMLTVQDAKHSFTKIEMPGIGTELDGHNSETVWKVSEMNGPEVIDDERKPMLLRLSKLNGMLSLEDDYESIECTGTEEFNGEECYVLVMKNEGEDPIYSYFSVGSKLQVGSKMTIVDPAQGKMEIVSKISDYKEVGGVKVAHTTTADLPIGISLVTEIESYEMNGEIDKSLFELPEEIQELLKEKEDK
jgi:hypothetical protein